jgi:DNA repair protein RecN (Recombination protein N)
MNKSFYLNSLTLNNFATFKVQEVPFTNDFNVIVGETGSGKSLLLDALHLIFGGRSDKKLIRKGSDFSTVEAIFTCTDDEIKAFFDKQGFPFESNEIVLKRIIYKNGKSKSYINYMNCNVSTLVKFSKRYIDLVGQFDNQKLLTSSYQLKLLDQYAGNSQLLKKYQTSFTKLQDLKKRRDQLITNSTSREQRLDYLNFQIDEIELLQPTVEDELFLSNRIKSIQNREKTVSLHGKIGELLSSDLDGSNLTDLLGKLVSTHSRNSDYLEELDINLVYSMQDLLVEYSSQLHDLDLSEIDENELNEVIERLDCYQKLKNKFGPSIDNVLTTLENFINEKVELTDNQLNLQNIDQDIVKTQKVVIKHSQELHLARLESSLLLSKNLTRVIRTLNMDYATIEIKIAKLNDLSITGNDIINIKAQTNQGEGYFNIKETASGGELSRILLAMRQVLSAKDSISIFLFDEIDTGIGGETALKIGKSLLDVSKNSQVIAITHLPQIVSYSNNIVHVSKEQEVLETETRTVSIVKPVINKNKFIKEMNPLN